MSDFDILKQFPVTAGGARPCGSIAEVEFNIQREYPCPISTQTIGSIHLPIRKPVKMCNK